MLEDIKDLNGVIDTHGQTIDYLNTIKKDFLGQIKSAETGVCETAEKLKSFVENHKQKLLKELDELRKNRVKEIEVLVDNVTQEKAMMASFKKYISEIIRKGTASDIARQANSLRSRFSEFMNIDETGKLVNQLGTVDVSFQTSDVRVDAAVNIVGRTVVKKTLKGNIKIITLSII